jgi:hypothetical protein
MFRKLTVIALVFSLFLLPASPVLAATRDFTAHLSGGEEVPSVETLAQGQAIFQSNKDGTELSFKLIAANIENTTASHIHLAPAGVNGPIVVALYPNFSTDKTPGIIAEGTITAANLIGPLAGHPLSDLLDAMEDGNTYVNIHTTQHPGGEIRGQVH